MGKYINYYDDILPILDSDGLEPSIIQIISNRSDGKTINGLAYLINQYKTNNEKFVLLYRNGYQLKCELIFNYDLKEIMKKDYNIEYDKVVGEFIIKDTVYQLSADFGNGMEVIGYSVSLKKYEIIKPYSGIFANVKNVFFDEVQLEDGNYLKNEVEKCFISTIATIGRGGGEQSRKLKIFLVSNLISLLSPYLVYYNIYKRYDFNKETGQIIRNKGNIAIFRLNKNAVISFKNNTMYNGMENSSYYKMLTGLDFLRKENLNTVQKLTGKFSYIATIIINNNKIGIRVYKGGIIHLGNYDPNCNKIYITNMDDYDENYYIFKKSRLEEIIKDSFAQGRVRFATVEIRQCFLEILAISI